MLKRTMSLLTLMVMVATLLAACGGTPASTPAGTGAEAPTAAPAATSGGASATTAPAAGSEPTAAPAATAGEPTAAPAAAPTAAVLVTSGGEGCAANAPKVTWYIGLGTGADADQIPREQAWVDNFNKSQTDACLIMQALHNPESYDALRAQLAAGTGPDIVGPVGKAGRAAFQGSWADITPLAQKAGFDLSKYDPALIEFTKDEGVLVGIPFALFPSFIIYNKDLFDEAKLPYPPHKVGDKYDGKEWNLDTFTELAKKLTVDGNGNTPNDASFDANTIKQFGFDFSYADARALATLFGGGNPYDPANPTVAKIPDNWRQGMKWHYDSIWKLHISPNFDYKQSDLLAKGNPFSSGNIAMAYVHTWYLGGLFDMKKFHWDIAAIPAVNGKTVAKLHGDTFAILKQSKNQDAAFKVLSQMVVAKDLFNIYGGMPATLADRPDFFKSLEAKAGDNKPDWSVAEEMVKYPDLPSHEAWEPNLIKAQDLFSKFQTLMDQSPDLNMDQELDKLQNQLTELYKTAPPPSK